MEMEMEELRRQRDLTQSQVDDPEVYSIKCRFLVMLFWTLKASLIEWISCHSHMQKGTVVEKLVEETATNDQHLRHLISICEGILVKPFTLVIFLCQWILISLLLVCLKPKGKSVKLPLMILARGHTKL